MQFDRVGVATALSPATVGHFKFLFHLLFVGLGLIQSSPPYFVGADENDMRENGHDARPEENRTIKIRSELSVVVPAGIEPALPT